MREHESTGYICAGARRLALAAALLLASAGLSQRVLAQDNAAPPPASDADSARTSVAPSSVWNAQRIRRVIDEGTHVVLTDGTVWEGVSP